MCVCVWILQVLTALAVHQNLHYRKVCKWLHRIHTQPWLVRHERYEKSTRKTWLTFHMISRPIQIGIIIADFKWKGANGLNISWWRTTRCDKSISAVNFVLGPIKFNHINIVRILDLGGWCASISITRGHALNTLDPVFSLLVSISNARQGSHDIVCIHCSKCILSFIIVIYERSNRRNRDASALKWTYTLGIVDGNSIYTKNHHCSLSMSIRLESQWQLHSHAQPAELTNVRYAPKDGMRSVIYWILTRAKPRALRCFVEISKYFVHGALFSYHILVVAEKWTSIDRFIWFVCTRVA